MHSAADQHFMRAALAEARKGLAHTSPNPPVGAVLVARGRIVATGFHRQAGAPHAEIDCLRNFGAAVPGDAVLYVTLEPCSTSGRTPPCTEALLAAGVKNLVVGTMDPNPAHRGRALAIMREAGVSVRSGILEAECAALSSAFNKWIQTQRPLVIAKCGMSLDGRLTRPPGEEQWLTSPAARRHANRMRAEVDAILIGAETLRRDDPRLTVRGIRGARQPWRVVLTRSNRLPRDAQMFTDRFADRTLVFRNRPLAAVLEELGQQEITSILIEGGGDILGQALDARLVDRVHLYVAALLTGGPVLAFPGRGAASSRDAMRLRNVRYEALGGDIFVSGDAAYEAAASE
ncbi:bifunctional diaminohydroxyphosphoribosylaminopyrimidine deaminase/5-amino-6-(5-phosphoribosylamino)uracil reductase RibD [soil metagenome]